MQEARNLARQAQKAEDVFCKFTNEQVDRILQNMVRVAEENAAKLARMAVEETGFGKVEDKIVKNQVASRDVYNYIKDMKTIGVIHEDTVNRITEIGEPVGVVLGIIPSTNPTSTVIYNAMIALKARNTIVFSPHPAALKCTIEAARLMAEAAETAGAPLGTISTIIHPSTSSSRGADSTPSRFRSSSPRRNARSCCRGTSATGSSEGSQSSQACTASCRWHGTSPKTASPSQGCAGCRGRYSMNRTAARGSGTPESS